MLVVFFVFPVFFCKGGNKLSDSWSDNKNSRNIPHGPGWAWDPYFKQGVLWKCHPSELEQRLDMWYRVSPWALQRCLDNKRLVKPRNDKFWMLLVDLMVDFYNRILVDLRERRMRRELLLNPGFWDFGRSLCTSMVYTYCLPVLEQY